MAATSLSPLSLHDLHDQAGARFASVRGMEVVEAYADPDAEYRVLRDSVGLLDLSSRSALALTGPDRSRFLHGQVTQEVNGLQPGQGCYAALGTAKGRIETDLNIFCLEDELILDFEPGMASPVTDRLEKYIIADDVEIHDVSPHYGLLSLQGPMARDVLKALSLDLAWPEEVQSITQRREHEWGDLYAVHVPRGPVAGVDVFVPLDKLSEAAASFHKAVCAAGGRWCGWGALDMCRVEAGLPRFGVDMDERNLVPETGIASRAISYNKGCYIGQEVIARIRTYGQVTKSLQGFQFEAGLGGLPAAGDKVCAGDKEVGYLTSVIESPTLQRPVALGYVRKEHNEPGTHLDVIRSDGGRCRAELVPLPFMGS